MSIIEALKKYLESCEDCREESKIVEFEDLPEEEKAIFYFYKNDKHFLLHCPKCKMFNVIGCR